MCVCVLYKTRPSLLPFFLSFVICAAVTVAVTWRTHLRLFTYSFVFFCFCSRSFTRCSTKSFKVNRWSTYLHSRSALLFNTTCHTTTTITHFSSSIEDWFSLSLFLFLQQLHQVSRMFCPNSTSWRQQLIQLYKVVLVCSIPGLVSLACVGSQKKKKTNCGCIHFSFFCRLSFQCKYVRFLIFLISEKSANHRQNHKVLSINKFASLPLCVIAAWKHAVFCSAVFSSFLFCTVRTARMHSFTWYLLYILTPNVLFMLFICILYEANS